VVRALPRAASGRYLRVMFPMISEVVTNLIRPNP
jgi:phosphoenolpyruvate-protein kinase (PTS system EI component)